MNVYMHVNKFFLYARLKLKWKCVLSACRFLYFLISLIASFNPHKTDKRNSRMVPCVIAFNFAAVVPCLVYFLDTCPCHRFARMFSLSFSFSLVISRVSRLPSDGDSRSSATGSTCTAFFAIRKDSSMYSRTSFRCYERILHSYSIER